MLHDSLTSNIADSDLVRQNVVIQKLKAPKCALYGVLLKKDDVGEKKVKREEGMLITEHTRQCRV